MRDKTQKLIISQLDAKLSRLEIAELEIPPKGWIYTIRTALKMTLRQLATKLGITSQSVKELENREKTGSITLRSLQEVADALDFKLVYILLPNKGTLQGIIEARAQVLAEEIVMRTSQSMKLESQEVSKERLLEAIQDKKEEIQREMPSYLWN